MSKKNEKLFFLSILAEQCGRYKDMVKYMEEIVSQKMMIYHWMKEVFFLMLTKVEYGQIIRY